MRLNIKAGAWLLGGSIFASVAMAAPEYNGTSVDELWDAVKSDPYPLPSYRISLSSMIGFGVSYIKRAADRTLAEQNDLLPRFTKLVHPNGVCLRGEWVIDQENPYSGFFAPGARGLVISRASTATSETKRGTYRAFGLATKVFPTENDRQVTKPGHLFVIDDLGGRKVDHFLDTSLTNEPATSLNSSSPALAPIIAAIGVAFSKADINPGIRQAYEVAELGVSPTTKAVVPKWVRLSTHADQFKIDAIDFRDEFDVTEQPTGTIQFDIAVASQILSNGNKDWQTIGKITYTDSVVSDTCDHRLHFHHPKFRRDL